MNATVVLILVATTASLTFTLLYGFRSKWYRNIVGRMQMNKSFSLSLVLILASVGSLTDADYPNRDAIRLAVYAYLAASLWIQVFVLVKIQNEKPNSEGSMSRRNHGVKEPI